MDGKKERKLQAQWRGPMRVAATRSEFDFEVKSIVDASRSFGHAQGIDSYPITLRSKIISSKLKQQAEQYVTKYHPVHSICVVRKNGANMSC